MEPKGCVETHPHCQSVKLGNTFVNLSMIARSQGLRKDYLSRIFSGQRTPSVLTVQKIAAALGLSVDEFLELLDDRLKLKQEEREKLMNQHFDRKRREALEDAGALRQGKAVAPRLPELKAS